LHLSCRFCSASQIRRHLLAALPCKRLQSLLIANQRTNDGSLRRLQNQRVLLGAQKLRDSRRCPRLRMAALTRGKPCLCYQRCTSHTTEATHLIQHNIPFSVSLVHSYAAILSGARPKCRVCQITHVFRRMTQTAHSYWRRWNKCVLTQLSLLTATAQKIVQYSQSAFFARLRPHPICAQPSPLAPLLAAQRRHVNLSKHTTSGSKLRNPIKQDYFTDLRSGRLSPSVACRTYASTSIQFYSISIQF
jgi:hypothetical protein